MIHISFIGFHFSNIEFVYKKFVIENKKETESNERKCVFLIHVDK